jgi:aldehyde dehydrogenase (NAD+)
VAQSAINTMMKLVPALNAGCTVLVKPVLGTPAGSYLLADNLDMGGVPPGVVNNVVAERKAGVYLVSHAGADKAVAHGPRREYAPARFW